VQVVVATADAKEVVVVRRVLPRPLPDTEIDPGRGGIVEAQGTARSCSRRPGGPRECARYGRRREPLRAPRAAGPPVRRLVGRIRQDRRKLPTGLCDAQLAMLTMKPISALLLLLLVSSSLRAAVPPEVYSATFEYDFADPQGAVTRRERVSGLYTRDLQVKTATWSRVSLASGSAGEEWGAPAAQPAMEGFTYPLRPPNILSNDFFRGIPATAFQDRNLVWDVRMFELFGEEQWAHLKPDTPYHYQSDTDVALAGAGTFTNHDVVLRLTGTTVRQGQRCSVVDYLALFNPIRLTMPGFALVGRSHYWGQLWVSASDKHLVAATLYEDVAGLVTEGTAPAAPTNVFRIGQFERVRSR
jgi:hypothetical protein